MKIAIFDLDDTLSDTSKRKHFVERPPGEKKDWASFYARCAEDDCVPGIVSKALELVGAGIPIAVLTGRTEAYRQPSLRWLSDLGITPLLSFFRPERDFRKSHQMKADWTEDMIAQGYQIICAYDDEPKNRVMFASKGIIAIDPLASSYEALHVQALAKIKVSESRARIL